MAFGIIVWACLMVFSTHIETTDLSVRDTACVDLAPCSTGEQEYSVVFSSRSLLLLSICTSLFFIWCEHYKLTSNSQTVYVLTSRARNRCPIDIKSMSSPIVSSRGAPEGFKYYHYNPSGAAAGIMFAAFAAATGYHLWKMFRARTWFFIPFVIGGFCKTGTSRNHAARH